MGQSLRLLLIEDDAKAAALLCDRFRAEGVVVEHAANGADGLALAQKGGFDVLVVDRMLPELSGTQLVENLRQAGDTTPVLFLSALGEVDDRVAGFEAGGDDYLTKPYAFAELQARVTALARRGEAAQTQLQLADLQLDLLAREARRGDTLLDLNNREFDLLAYLASHQGQVVTRHMLLQNVWNYGLDTQTNVVDVHISRLRAKLDKDFTPPLLHTKRGQGFVLQVEA
ncbi:MAG: response regulator transcription factor [Parvibaculales bacterium]